MAWPIGRHVARFATAFRTDAPDAVLVLVSPEFGSVLVVWVERLEGLGVTPAFRSI